MLKRTSLILLALLLLSLGVFAQKGSEPNDRSVGPYRSSPAFGEVMLRKAELEADLESMLDQYTEDNPQVKMSRYELSQLVQEMDRIFAVPPAETGKLTTALGKMIVKKVALQADLFALEQRYGPQHPQVKRARKKAEAFERAVREILK